MPRHTDAERAKNRAAKKKKKPDTRNPFMQFILSVFDPTGSLEEAGNVFDRVTRDIERDTETIRRRRR